MSMKSLLLLVAIATHISYAAFSQDLAYKIPERAFTVASLKSEQLLQLSSIAEFDNSAWGLKLLKKISADAGSEFKSIGDMGINFSAKSYYYHQITDSVSYNGFLIPLSDAKMIDSLLGKTNVVMDGNGYKYIIPGKKSIISWNSEMLFILSGKPAYSFFEDSAVGARYGLQYEPKYGDGDEEVMVDSIAPVTDYYNDTTIDTLSAEDIALAPPPPVIPAAAPEQPYEERNDIKDTILMAWMRSYTKQTFDKKPGAPSVLNITTYAHSEDKNALVTFWMSDMSSMYTAFLPYTLMKYGSLTNGYGSFTAKLYLDNKQIRINSELGLDGEKAGVYKAVTANKLNRRFLKYINSDSLIGFMSYAINTEAYLKQMPRLFKGFYGKYDEEAEIVADFISLLLDEKAIARVAKGDALFILSGLNKREVTYKSYAYDEETFEYKDTIKTKVETVPDFLCMFSSDDTQFIERFLAYGIRKELIAYNDGIYSIKKMYNNPLMMHLLIRDGIVFLGTSMAEISKIKNGTYKAVVNKQQKELLMKNNLSLFFNPKNLGSQLPEGELGELAGNYKALLGDAGNVYIKTAGIKDGYVSMDLTADVPEEKGNGLNYVVELINQMMQLK